MNCIERAKFYFSKDEITKKIIIHMDLNLKSKKVLIVGASKGIGRGIVMGFAQEHTHIVGVARTEELLIDVKQEALNKGAASFEYEVSDIINGDCKALAQKLLDKYGLFDVIVHNVGTSLCGNNHLGASEDWIVALRTNALASIDMNSVFLPPMIEGKRPCHSYLLDFSSYAKR